MSIEALVFDIGNVLVRFDFSRALRRLEEECKRPLDALYDALIALKDRYEEGQVARTDFVSNAIELLQYPGETRMFSRIWQEIFEENLPMTRLIPDLARRFPLYLLSNTSDLHMEYIREQYPVFAHLPHGIYSYAEGCAKPGERIFQICVERFQLRPERCLYVDDLAANVATARRAGFQVFHYDPDRHDDFLRHARSLGVLPSE